MLLKECSFAVEFVYLPRPFPLPLDFGSDLFFRGPENFACFPAEALQGLCVRVHFLLFPPPPPLCCPVMAARIYVNNLSVVFHGMLCWCMFKQVAKNYLC